MCIRDSNSAVPKIQIELRGTVLGVSATRSFLSVRGVRLFTLPALDTCVQDGVYVQVKAQSSDRAPGLWIDDIRCISDQPSSSDGAAVVAQQGEVANLSLALRSFKLKNTSLTVAWDDQTYFKNTTRTTLRNGTAVEVEGVIVGSTLRARKIKGE